MTDKERALITGASAGIGLALATEFARSGHDLVLVARREAELEALARKLREAHDVEVLVHPADLAADGAARDLAAALAATPIGILVNNAGVLHEGAFRKMDSTAIEAMIRVNIVALTSLCREFIGPMIEHGRGRILNLASIAAFQSVPTLAVYAATKAYVLSLGEALAIEGSRHGVTVTTVCPGFTDTAMLRGAPGASAPMAQVPDLLVMSPERVAGCAYRACMAGRALEVPGIVNTAAATASKLTPRWVQRTLSGLALGVAAGRRARSD